MYWFQLRQRITGKVIETGFYMGTMAQAIDREGGFDLFSERGLGSIREDVFVDVCGN